MKIYSKSGIIVQTVLMDTEFNKTIDNLMENIVVKTSAEKEHVVEIERTIFTVKENTICIFATIPFKYLHKLLITNIVYFLVSRTNAFTV